MAEETLSGKLTQLKEWEDKLENNPVATFAYTQAALEDKDLADGVEIYDYAQENNIPVADSTVLNTNPTVLEKGFRSQASSITRMLMNHFLGRVSYNLNKTVSVVAGTLSNIISFIGQPNGIAPLGSDGRIPNQYLPETAIEFLGLWDAETNTPSISDSMTGATKGDFYIVSVAGTKNLGSGDIQFFVNDRVIYDGTKWNRLSAGDVKSVNGVLPDAGDIKNVIYITKEQYDILSTNQKKGKFFIVDNEQAAETIFIDDSVTSLDTTWSSTKISTDVITLAETVVRESIDDVTPSTSKVFSSSKTMSEITSKVNGLIDDSYPDTDKVYSSNKVTTEINALIDDVNVSDDKVFSSSKVTADIEAVINDDEVSEDSTYSSSKIEADIAAVINDTTASTTTAYSSSKVNELFSLQLIFDRFFPVNKATVVQLPSAYDMETGEVRYDTEDPNITYNGNGLTSTWIELDYDGSFFRTNGGLASTFGSGVQEDDVKPHTHGVTDPGHAHNVTLGYEFYANIGGYPVGANIAVGSSSLSNRGTVGVSTSTTCITINDSTGTETRPKNQTMKVWLRVA